MIISHKYKFIFIKTRKTAGSSIEKYLSAYLGPSDICTGSLSENTPTKNTDYLDGHKSWKFIYDNFPTEFDQYFKFSVERNSWDKVVSYYYYSLYKKPKRSKNGFHNFVKKYANNIKDWNLYTENNLLRVDRILSYENLHQELLSISERVPYNNELLTTKIKSNFRPSKTYTEYYNSESYNDIFDIFSKEINFFNYKF